ncbi:hypothetical protein [Glutamicibacter protophormiae]|uniref:hypothetical protein n=1 Tax=Glutamicibacter protophormiae TaxID=37930 RepID=UPI003A8E8884
MVTQRSRQPEGVIPGDGPAAELHVEKRGNDEYVIVDPDGNVHSKVLSYLSMFAARQHAKNAVAFLPTITLSPNMKALLKYQIPGE